MQHAVGGPEDFASLLVGIGDKSRRMHPDRMSGRAELRGGPAVQVQVRGEPLRGSADDGEHKPQTVIGGTYNRLR
ncbi:MAG: hypothetical protein QOE94_2025 [Mycobacterium sp.]|nr:hypothetical protein [Mycobacterium sp.]